MAEITSPVAGFVAKISVNQGDQVIKGEIVSMVQCMKTEIPVVSETSGIVSEIRIQEGEEIDLGDVILVVS